MLRKILVFAVVVAVASLVVASAADVNWPDNNAGYAGVGATNVLALQAYNVQWGILAADPLYYDSVQFDISPAANAAYASAGTCGGGPLSGCSYGAWATCTPSSGGTHWTCDLANGLIQPMQALQVSSAR